MENIYFNFFDSLAKRPQLSMQDIIDRETEKELLNQPILRKINSMENRIKPLSEEGADECLKILKENGPIIQLSDNATVEYIFSERDTIKEFINTIKPDIESIDCGCQSCIDDFLLGVNPALEKFGLELKYNGQSTNHSLGLDLIDKTEDHPL